jgi:uncharacterized linocin/CFP29 family protein
MDYLNRGQSHLPDAIWREIDKAAAEAARDRLTGRRFLELQGPFGAGLTSIEAGNDDYCRQPSADEAGAVMGRAISVPMLRRAFRLSVRRIPGYLENGQPLDLTPAQDAAEAVANREEEFIYRGQPDFRLPGLLTHEDRQQLDGGDWAAVERALSDVLAAVTQLDEPGIAGHMPWRWLRRSTMGCSGSIPAPTSRRSRSAASLHPRHLQGAAEGGVLVDPRVGALVLGQDLRAGYIGQDGVHHQLYLTESIVLRIDEPRAICTISATSSSLRIGATSTPTPS